MQLKYRVGGTKRAYDGAGRRAQAARSRSAVLAAAERLFLADGYAATTIAKIAEAAEVSVETVYKGFGGKPGLVRSLAARGLTGQGRVPAERRSDEMRLTERDPHRIIANWGTLGAEVAPRIVPIMLLVRAAAATDPEMATLFDELNTDRLRRMTINAGHLYETGSLRRGVTLADAVDILYTYSSPELFELLVVRRGWTPERYGGFIAEAMRSALLPQRR